jgi:1-acyl-sn-glycerol-3-phosphate acyltransferase
MLGRQWRICATGLCFITFMLGALLVTSLVFPVLNLFPLPKTSKQRHIRHLIYWSFRFFMGYMRYLGPIKSFETHGIEHMQNGGPYIFIANHPTLIDIVAIMSCVPFCTCIIKKSLWDHFYLGKVVRSAGYIVNDHATQLIEACQTSFNNGYSLVIFPEGTRSPAYGIHPFNRGAAQIALRLGIPVVPIVITYNCPTLMKGQAWYEVPRYPLRLTLQFHPPLAMPAERYHEANLPRKVRSLTRYFEDFFREHTNLNHDSSIS